MLCATWHAASTFFSRQIGEHTAEECEVRCLPAVENSLTPPPPPSGLLPSRLILLFGRPFLGFSNCSATWDHGSTLSFSQCVFALRRSSNFPLAEEQQYWVIFPVSDL